MNKISKFKKLRNKKIRLATEAKINTNSWISGCPEDYGLEV